MRMPFELKNSPSTFQQVKNNSLTGIQNEKALVYIYDIIVYSLSLQEHIVRRTEILRRQRNAHLKLQQDKCELVEKKYYI